MQATVHINTAPIERSAFFFTGIRLGAVHSRTLVLQGHAHAIAVAHVITYYTRAAASSIAGKAL
jgi:hypothetical protein